MGVAARCSVGFSKGGQNRWYYGGEWRRDPVTAQLDVRNYLIVPVTLSGDFFVPFEAKWKLTYALFLCT